MKKKESMNAVGRVLMVLAIAALMVSCSTRGSEVEEVSAIDSNIVVHENNEIRVEFQLKNAAGQAMTAFSEGEQIVFHLSIINKTDKKMDDILPGIVVYDDVFFVYSAEDTPGKVVGKPWDGMIKKGLEPGLRNEKVYNYECSWLGANKMDENGYILDLKQGTGGIAFFTTDPRTPLAKGKYYTEFQVHINDGQTIICHKDFSVISK